MTMLRLAPAIALSVSIVAQARWTQLAPGASPSPRTEVALADAGGLEILLFGGLNGGAATAYDELWAFDGSAWMLRVPTSAAPPARSRFAAGWDFVRQRFVIFGGDAQYVGGGAYGDTWTWDPSASTWTQMLPTNSPSPRIHSRMAFDVLGGAVMVMFGGRGAGGAETWTWDGVDWTLQQPTTSPPPREQPHLVYDWTAGHIVMFGGATGAASGIVGDTWIWSGGNWSQLSPVTTPGVSGIRNGKMTYDWQRQRLVLHGGVAGSGGFSSSVWEFDGIDWRERLPTIRPAGRAGAGVEYLRAIDATVLFGGYNGGFFNDTWTWQTDSPATVTSSGVGCPTSRGDPTLGVAGRPWIGDRVDFTVHNVPTGGVPFLAVGLSPTTAPLTSLGFPNCAAITPAASLFAPGPVMFPIANDPGFVGIQLHAQAAVVEPTGPGFTLGLSRVESLRVGVR